LLSKINICAFINLPGRIKKIHSSENWIYFMASPSEKLVSMLQIFGFNPISLYILKISIHTPFLTSVKAIRIFVWEKNHFVPSWHRKTSKFIFGYAASIVDISWNALHPWTFEHFHPYQKQSISEWVDVSIFIRFLQKMVSMLEVMNQENYQNLKIF
jgi:hypothetical protein